MSNNLPKDGSCKSISTKATFLPVIARLTAKFAAIKLLPSPGMLVKRIDEVNKINTLKNAAIIFNGIKTRGFVKNNYGYGYDYVYGGDKKNKKAKKAKA
jgi:hypothetical protein